MSQLEASRTTGDADSSEHGDDLGNGSEALLLKELNDNLTEVVRCYQTLPAAPIGGAKR